MKKTFQFNIRKINKQRILMAAIAVFALVGGWMMIQPQSSEASTPNSGNISPNVGNMTSWVGDRATPVPPAANGEPSCSTGNETATNCDSYTLVVAPGDWSGKRISVTFNWQLPANDYDMVVRQESNGVAGLQGDGLTPAATLDAIVGTSGNGTNTFEEVIISPPNEGATYYVRAIYFAGGGPADQYQGRALVENTAVEAPTAQCQVPTFDNYQPPVGFEGRDDGGEPSVGVNWNTGNIMSIAFIVGARTTFTDSTSPADPVNGTIWSANTSPLLQTNFDPILFTDNITGRTVAGGLIIAAGTTQGFVSDDDFSTMFDNFTTGGPTQGVDHQTIGGGPPNPAATTQPIGAYPHMLYYASQSIATATVSASVNGGLSYLPAVPAYTLAECNGLHGHIKVAPDGTVYLPNKGCGGKAGFARSTDNGLTWQVRTAPNSTSGSTDPSVGIGAGGRVFLGYSGADNHPHVAVSDDRGDTFPIDFDLSTSVGAGKDPLTAAVFMQSVAGDNDRAQIFFLATDSKAIGDPVGDDAGVPYKGTWFPYVAYTCDGGKSWSVVKADNSPANPGKPNPVQQGVVCTNGTTCPGGTRNLLDFNEATVDSRGRFIGVYADGCNFEHPCINILDNSGDRTRNQGGQRLTLIRQRGGMRLFSAFDAAGPAAPSLSPPVNVSSQRSGYNLSWATPDDNGSPITSYKVYRGLPGGSEQMIAEVSGSENSFIDRRFGSQNNRGIYYRVTATNQFGESPKNVKFFAADGRRSGSKEKSRISSD